MWAISYWTFPLAAAFIWLAMLLAMFISWFHWGQPHLASMQPTQHIAYISNVGATYLKPLFIAMGTATVVLFTFGFVSERWLRHTGRLAHNTSWTQKILSFCAIIAGIAGAVGLILLTIFDTLHHKHLHDTFLVLFIAGYILNAIFSCAEYQRLGIHYREFRVLRYSFWVKLSFIFIEIGLAIGFGVENLHKSYDVAAILEWIIALVFFFYVLSYFIDFVPAWQDSAKHTIRGRRGPPMAEVAEEEGRSEVPLTADGGVDRYRYGHAPNEGRYYGGGFANGMGGMPKLGQNKHF